MQQVITFNYNNEVEYIDYNVPLNNKIISKYKIKAIQNLRTAIHEILDDLVIIETTKQNLRLYKKGTNDDYLR